MISNAYLDEKSEQALQRDMSNVVMWNFAVAQFLALCPRVNIIVIMNS